MKKYGAEVIHFATGMLAGYPPCIYIENLKKYTEELTGLPVIIGTHPMPKNYIEIHEKIGDWTETHRNWLKEFNQLNMEESDKYDSTKEEYWDLIK